MVDWLKVWRRAQFGGAHFWTESTQAQTGRRLVIHEFPHKNTPYVEDMGRSANHFTVTAYVASDDALGEARALFSACGRRGAQTLQLPDERLRAHCESCERAWNKDKQGYIAFSLTFWRDGAGAGPYPAPYLQRLTFAAALALPDAITSLVDGSILTLGTAGFVRDAAADDVRGIAVALESARVGLNLHPEKAPAIARAIQDLHDDADGLTQIGTVGDVLGPEHFVARQVDASSANLVRNISDIIERIRDAATARDVAPVLAGLTDPPAPSGIRPTTPSRRQQIANAGALSLALRIAALGQWAVAVTEIAYHDRRAAIQARADLAERFDAVLDILSGPDAHAMALALGEVRNTAIQYLTRMLTDLAPVQIFISHKTMPSLWWAYRLYGDAARASELVSRNQALHASFMPLEVEALAR